MKFLQLCLWTCIAALAVSQLPAQQTPEQKKKIADDLRKAQEGAADLRKALEAEPYPDGKSNKPAKATTPAPPPPAENLPAVDTKAADKARKESEAQNKAKAAETEKAAA